MAKDYRPIRKIVKAAWLKDPRCKICGCLTVIQRSGCGVQYKNIATYGHIYSKWDIRRLIKENVWQIECFECNNGKERKENPNYEYNKTFKGHHKKFSDPYPELLVSLAETKDNDIYLTQIEFKKIK